MKKNCENCLGEFETDSGKKRFCSDRCRVAFNRAKDKALAVIKATTKSDASGKYIELNWIKEIEDYCSNAGVLPADLIEFHRNHHKPIKGKEKGKEVIVKDLTKSNVVGKPYDPMKNPRFLGKISTKRE